MKKRIKYFYLILSSLLVIASCKNSSDSGLVKTVENGVEKWFYEDDYLKQKPEQIELKELFVIGQLDGDTNYVFSYITNFDIDRQGNIFLYDYGMKKISKFSRDGKFVTSFCYYGGGPGEAKNVGILKAMDEFILVYDYALDRISQFAFNGSFVNSYQLNSFNRIKRSKTVRGHIEGIYPMLDNNYVFGFEKTDQVNAKNFVTYYYDKDKSADMDSLFSISIPINVLRSKDGAAGIYSNLKLDCIKINRDRFLCSFSENYELKIYDKNGKLCKIIIRKYNRQHYSSAEKEAANKRAVFVIDGKKIYRELPKFKQDIQGIFFDDQNKILVLTSTGNENDGYLYDIYDEDGKWVKL